MDRRPPTPALIAALITALIAVLAPVPALGDDLAERRARVERRLDKAAEQLEESTTRARKASLALLRARAELGLARGHLARTRGELLAAEALDRQLQAELDAAGARLARARHELTAGRRELAEQEDRLRVVVADAYQGSDPDLLGLSLVLTTQDPAELASRMNADDDVLNLQTSILDQLAAARVVLTVQREELAAARREVAGRRKAAAENLSGMRTLEAQAEQAAQQVRSQVGKRREARSQAVRARVSDQQAIRQLRAERTHVQSLIRRRAARTAYSGSVDSGGVLAAPVSGSITSGFGYRTHPIWGYRSMHDGIDFGVGCGTPVRAAAAGTVLATYYSSAWGNRVILDHGVVKGVGLATISNHLASWSVTAGQQVSRGQVIGYVGTTGWSTGCHLHYTVLRNGTAVDPAAWL